MKIRHVVLGLVAVGVALGVIASCGGGRRPEAEGGSWQPPATLPRSAALAADRLAFDSDRTGNFELFVMGDDGSAVSRLTTDPAYDSWGPRLAPDRRTIVFSRTPKGVHDRDPKQTSLWVVAADGSGLGQLRPTGMDGWGLVGHPEWSPDGAALVMVGGASSNAQIFITDALGQQPRALTDRPGTNIDPSFAPDGSSVLFVGCPQAMCTPSSYEVYSIPVTGGTARRVTQDNLPDYDPVWSPDGSELAWLTNINGGTKGVWDVRIRGQDGQVRRLMGDRTITSRPQYSADGRTIFLHRIPPGRTTFSVVRVRPDGTGLVDLTPAGPGNNEYPSP